MKYLIGLFIPFIVACASQNDSNIPQKVPSSVDFLVAGQSNAVSIVRSPYDTPYTSITPVSAYSTNTGDFTIDYVNYSTASLVWQRTGDLLPYPCRFRNVAVGGTSITTWVDILHTRIDNALAMHHYKAILWIQGETDMLNGLDGDVYYNDLKQVILYSRAVQPSIPWYIAYGMGGGPNDAIRLAQLRLIQEGIVLAGPDLDSIRIPSNMDDLQLHFVGPGILAMSRIWASILNTL